MMTTSEIEAATFEKLQYWHNFYTAADRNEQNYNASERKRLGLD